MSRPALPAERSETGLEAAAQPPDSQASLFERAFVVAGLLIFARALLPLILTNQDRADVLDPAAGDASIRLVFLGIYAIAGILVLFHIQTFFRTALRDKWMLTFALLPLVSVFWATNPTVTLRSSVALMLTTMFGLYIATRFSLSEQLRLLAVAMAISLVLSIAFVFFLPERGLMPTGPLLGDWRGIYLHKNALGRMMDISIVVFLLIALSGGSRALLAWFGVVVSTAVLLMTNSTGAVGAAVALLVVVALTRLLQRSRSMLLPILIVVFMCFASIVFLSYVHLSSIVGSLDESKSFTGRTDLWRFLIQNFIRERPILGYGYESFWLGWKGPSAEVWSVFEDWLPPSAHNGLLDIWLDLGLVGVGLFIGGVIVAYQRAIVWAQADPSWEGAWPFILLSLLLLTNVVEAVMLRPNGLLWMLYVATTCTVARQTAELGERRTQPISTPVRPPVMQQPTTSGLPLGPGD